MKKTLIVLGLMAILSSANNLVMASQPDPINIGINNKQKQEQEQTLNSVVDVGVVADGGDASVNGVTAGATSTVNFKSYPGYVGSQAVSGARTEALSAAEMDIFFEGVSTETVAYYADHGGKLKDFEIKWLRPADSPTTFVRFSERKPENGVYLGVLNKEMDADSYDINMSIAKASMEHGGNLVQVSILRRVDAKTSSRGIGTGGLLCLVGVNAGINAGSTRETDGTIVFRFTIWKVTQTQVPQVVVIPAPQPVHKSSLTELRLKITELREVVDHCPTPNWNNGRSRAELGYKHGLLGEQLTGDERVEALSESIANLDVAIADLTNGVENDGTKTRDMAVAQRTIKICQKNRAVAYELGGNEQLAAQYRKAIAARKLQLARAAKK